jgi:hypothetical protein
MVDDCAKTNGLSTQLRGVVGQDQFSQIQIASSAARTIECSIFGKIPFRDLEARLVVVA